MRNIVALFHVLERDEAWRAKSGKAAHFNTLKSHKPIIAAGPSKPLEDDELMVDYAHGLDGLHGVHEKFPELSPPDGWQKLFDKGSPCTDQDGLTCSKYFIPSKEPSHKEILRILKENPADSITIIALGPMTTLALAAAEDAATFLKVKEVVVMGGAILGGNITPVAEFNTYADAVATARVFALTSPDPASVLPPGRCAVPALPLYPASLWRRLNLTLAPLNITSNHRVHKRFFNDMTYPFLNSGSPLALWVHGIMRGTFDWGDLIRGKDKGIPIHDALTIWYVLTASNPAWVLSRGEDIRVETTGQWTKGMHVLDGRGYNAPDQDATADESGGEPSSSTLRMKGDTMGWFNKKMGNRINRLVESPGEDMFETFMLGRIFR